MFIKVIQAINVTDGLNYEHLLIEFENRKNFAHLIKYNCYNNENLTLLISKLSEAIKPNSYNNHIGDGCNLDTLIKHQKGIRFVINAGFNHYRKKFYFWPHQNFNIGDPVCFVKIRNHVFNDFVDSFNNNYGTLCFDNKNFPVFYNGIFTDNFKYILTSSPYFIHNNKKIELPKKMIPVDKGFINPPSYLGHGNEIHPRTAVGIKDNELYFIVVENNSSGNGGCTLSELQNIGCSINLDCFLNLDGGGSTQFKIFMDNEVITNYVLEEDRQRILGHAFIIFDEDLK